MAFLSQSLNRSFDGLHWARGACSHRQWHGGADRVMPGRNQNPLAWRYSGVSGWWRESRNECLLFTFKDESATGYMCEISIQGSLQRYMNLHVWEVDPQPHILPKWGPLFCMPSYSRIHPYVWLVSPFSSARWCKTYGRLDRWTDRVIHTWTHTHT